MKSLKILIELVFIGALLSQLNSCKKDEIEFGSLTDIEGNTYKTVKIGSQVFMAENLKTLKLNDGTVIPQIKDAVTWKTLTTPAYCWYNNDSTTYKELYGPLYNWHTVITGKLCPSGWHVPIYTDWKNLNVSLGGTDTNYGITVGKLKETDTVLWVSPNEGATNSTDFKSIPGGYRDKEGKFNLMGYQCRFWSASEDRSDTLRAWYFLLMNYPCSGGLTSSEKTGGFSVRCIRD